MDLSAALSIYAPANRRRLLILAAQMPRTRKLTEREQQVLIGVFEGLANKQIADRLNFSEISVKATLQQLFQKTGVRNGANWSELRSNNTVN